ncbi:MAG: 4Fe-4S binding protein [Kiritimatiellales bacterium]|nr:4Fe-4S binding protein [Kiritimatiellales bacterium]
MKSGRQFIRLLTVSMLGFFSLIAQTLLFRDFLSVYEGSELGIGVFFGSWLVWVALGALTARRIRQKQNIDLLFLLYLPAFIFQQFLILHSRELAGIKAYELFPFIRMLPVSFIANAPVSFMTGLLFPLACRWFENEEQDIPVSRVYTCEAMGSFLGGAAVTAMLAAGLTAERIFLSAALVLTVAVLLSSKRKIAMPLVIFLLVAFAFSKHWNNLNNRAAWARLLSVEQYEGSFTTTHARYLYGSHRGQFSVVSSEAVTESVPQAEYASELAALHLAQKPDAENVLVVGGSYALCRRLAEVPTLGKTVWLHPDTHYPTRLLAALPPELKTGLDKLEMPATDVRSFLQNGQLFDLIILNLPDASTLSINRYFTVEFFQLVRQALTPGGRVGIRVSGGENFMGGELLRIGASVFQTLERVFPAIGIKPGDETWLLASTGGNVLTQNADELVTRYASIDGAGALYPPAGLRSLYPADRAEFQLKAYRGIADENLINSDRHPLALFHTLLLTGRQSGAGDKTVQAMVSLSKNGFIPVLALILLYGLLRAVYLRRPSPGSINFDSGFLVASAGFAGLALNVVLMFLFQSRFGSIFLYIGLISSLFMAGLFCGALLARRKNILVVTLPLHALCTVALILLPAGLPMAAYFALLFGFGFFSGTYIPATAMLLTSSALRTGSAMEMCDHLGGALGGLLIGILFLPTFGIYKTLILLAALLAVNILPMLGRRVSKHWKSDPLRQIGYVLFGIAALMLVVRHAVPRAGGDFEEAVKSLDAGPGAHGFDSRKHAPNVYGYGGPLSMAVALDETGKLLDFRIYEHRETPTYLRMVEPWMEQFVGLNLFSDDVREIDVLSGATITCAAFRQTLVSGAESFQGRDGSQPRSASAWNVFPLIVFAALCFIAVALRKGTTRRVRQLFLMLVVLAAGFQLNMQYSTDHLFRLLALELPPLQSIVPLLLTVAVPILVLLFGNIYCGWLCPFGALQELAGSCNRRTPDKAAWRYARFIKYILLFVLVALFANVENDPLTSFFSATPSVAAFGFAAAALILSIVFGRFWCRNLCPAGAFLALLNRARLLKRWIPKVPFARCDYGVRSIADLDCICCDRCTFPIIGITETETSNRWKIRGILLVFAAVVFAAVWIGVALSDKEEVAAAPSVRIRRGEGRARNVDMQLLRAKIERGELSDREALFYDKLGFPAQED